MLNCKSPNSNCYFQLKVIYFWKCTVVKNLAILRGESNSRSLVPLFSNFNSEFFQLKLPSPSLYLPKHSTWGPCPVNGGLCYGTGLPHVTFRFIYVADY